MGFRSTFTTTASAIPIPPWFASKWEDAVHFGGEVGAERFPISSKDEAKAYHWHSLVEDLSTLIAQARRSKRLWSELVLLFVHECGGISRVEFGADGTARWSEPADFEECEGPRHSYCYGC